MKSCLITFKRKQDALNYKTVNGVISLFNGANFSLDDIYVFSDFENNFENICKIRQAYDTVYLLNLDCNKELQDTVNRFII